MAHKSRVYHSLKNARVSLFFTLISIFIGFFSRKIFLDRLGVEFIGLSSTLQCLLGFLNIAELGIGTAISYSLYKPLAQGNRDELNDIISVLGYLYSRVGAFILSAGVLISFFLPLIFHKVKIPFPLIYFGYYTYLITSLFSYFLNYRMTLLVADQRNYVVSKYLQLSSITQLLVQMTAAKYCANLYLFFAITLFFSGIYCFILNSRINAYYPWLKTSITRGKEKLRDFQEIKKKIKQVFIHKIGGISQKQLVNILVYAFVSLKDVALLGNYMTVISKASLLSECVMGGTWASVGNVVASSNKNKIFEVYEELVAARCIVSVSVVFSLYHLLEPFIGLWLGNQYIMKHEIMLLLLAESFMSLTRGVNDQFITAYGLFFDIWVSFVELAMLISGGMLLGHFWGMSGIMLSMVGCKVFTVLLWKPFMLFKYGFLLPIKYYFKLLCHVIVVISLIFLLGGMMVSVLPGRLSYNWTVFCIYSIIVFLLGTLLTVLSVTLILPGGKRLGKRFFGILANWREFV